MTARNSALMLLNRCDSIGRRCLMSALPEKMPLRARVSVRQRPSKDVKNEREGER